MDTNLTLHAIRGPVDGAEFCLTAPGKWVIGRSQDCDLNLPDTPASRITSRRHCRLELTESGAFVQDLGSRNGTFVNGKCIGHRPTDQRPDSRPRTGEGYPLAHGDELKVGDTLFRVAFPDAVEMTGKAEKVLELVAGH